MPFEISPCEKKGWFSPALFRKNLTRFWPLAVGYGLLQFFLLPMTLITQLDYAAKRGGEPAESLIASQLADSAVQAVPLGLAFGILTAMALFSYLMNNRSAGMLHALPIRRGGLFFTNWLSGLCFFLVPNTAVCLMALAVQSAYGGVQPLLSLRWFALHTVIAMFFFCFGVCCAMFTGHILALPVFYGVLNGLAAGLCALTDQAVNMLLVGYNGNTLFSHAVARWCTPLWHILSKVEAESSYRWGEGTAIALGYCLVLGAVFTLIAVIAYQCRQLERAGDVVSVSWVRPIFQWGVGVCTGLVLGVVVYQRFFSHLEAWVFIGMVGLFAAAGAFVARMFLKKTLRVFADGWKSCGAVGLAMLLLLGGARADLLGYQRWTPDPEKVESVRLYHIQTLPYDSGRSGITITDPELVARTVALHRGLVEELSRLEKASREGPDYGRSPEGWETVGSTGIQIEYAMRNGGQKTRWYTAVPISEEELADPGSYAAQLEELLNQPEIQRQRYLNWLEDKELTVDGGWLSNTWGEGNQVKLTAEQALTIWEAFLEDLEAGRIRCYLLDGKERMENCYYSDIEFTLIYPWNDPETGKWEDRLTGLSVTVQRSADSMMAALEREGLKELLLSRQTAQEDGGREILLQ